MSALQKLFVVYIVTVAALLGWHLFFDESVGKTRWERWMRKQHPSITLHLHASESKEVRKAIAGQVHRFIVETVRDGQRIRLFCDGELSWHFYGGAEMRHDGQIARLLLAYVDGGLSSASTEIETAQLQWELQGAGVRLREAPIVYFTAILPDETFGSVDARLREGGWRGVTRLRLLDDVDVVVASANLPPLVRLRVDWFTRSVSMLGLMEAGLAFPVFGLFIWLGWLAVRRAATHAAKRARAPAWPGGPDYRALDADGRAAAATWWRTCLWDVMLFCLGGFWIAVSTSAQPLWVAALLGATIGAGLHGVLLLRAWRRLRDAMVLSADLEGGSVAALTRIALAPEVREALLARSSEIQGASLRASRTLADPAKAFRRELWVAEHALVGVSRQEALAALELSVRAEGLLLAAAREVEHAAL